MIGVLVTICLLLSLVESQFVLPAHLAHHLRPETEWWENTRKRNKRLNEWDYSHASLDVQLDRGGLGCATRERDSERHEQGETLQRAPRGACSCGSRRPS